MDSGTVQKALFLYQGIWMPQYKFSQVNGIFPEKG
jgi:hypothetical protein